jgi:SAM-dependent methyltransferase
MPDRRRAFDLVEAFHLSHAVAALHNLGLLTTLKEPATVDELSARYSLDPVLLGGTLEYLAARTDLLRKSGGRYVATKNYSDGSRFLLDLYVGAYGGNGAQLAKLLRNPSTAPAAVDRVLHARAFATVDGSALGALPEIIGQLGFNHLLDLGCGNGALLLELANQDPDFAGWGIDFNRAMCKVARARLRDAGVGRRVLVRQGDCRRPGTLLPAKVSSKVRTVTACNVVNEWFTEGDSSVIAWLQNLRQVLPGRPLLIADYYGRLGQTKRRKSEGRGSPETLLHDYIQLISGQGVPPATRVAWRSIYSQAGCHLLHVIEDKNTTRFIHILAL